MTRMALCAMCGQLVSETRLGRLRRHHIDLGARPLCPASGMGVDAIPEQRGSILLRGDRVFRFAFGGSLTVDDANKIAREIALLVQPEKPDDGLHPDGCHIPQNTAPLNPSCPGDGHHSCRSCVHFDYHGEP